MESKYTRINFIIIIFFIGSMIYTTLKLFSLQDELILGVSTLSSDDISELSTVLNTLNIPVALSLITGLIAIFLNYKTDEGNTSYQASHSKEESSKDNGEIDDLQVNDSVVLDLSTVQKAIKSNADKKEKHTAVLTAICKKVEAGQGAIYLTKESKEERVAQLYTSFAFHISETETLSFAFGEGLVGQVAVEANTLIIDDVPENYINIVSGLGNASPRHLLITPMIKNKKVIGVVELASFTEFSKDEEAWIKEGLNLLVSTTNKSTAPDDSESKKKKTASKKE